jgi:IS6 family transposase
MRALRNGQAAIFNLTQDMRGETWIVERSCGLGPSVIAETMQFVSERLRSQTA